MARLYDRALSPDFEPFTERHLERLMMMGALRDEGRREELSGLFHRPPTDEEVAILRYHQEQELELTQVSAGEVEDLMQALRDAVVISAEEVAGYCYALPGKSDLVDLVASVAPPFSACFVEFQDCGKPAAETPSGPGIEVRTWGVCFSGERGEDGSWLMDARLVCELQRGAPFGSVVHWRIPLHSDGTLAAVEGGAIPVDAGGNWILNDEHLKSWLHSGDVLGQEGKQAYFFVGSMGRLLLPALFALSLMHCKNVDIRPVDPPERLSRRHQRKHGRPLTRYHVLDIQPMRRILDGDGEAQTKGLRQALHICRGHFKSYTEDAPLFGKRVGTYWWDAQVRGKAEEGEVEKDYRIRLDQGLGREYIAADEHPEIKADASEHTGLDPDIGGRGLRAHNVTQNLLASIVEEAGHVPRRPKPDEPQYDLAWEAGEITWVGEVKSITPQNEERQLRQALGQVLRYRQLLVDEGRVVRALIAVERQPSDATWADLCADEGIVLVWPPIELSKLAA